MKLLPEETLDLLPPEPEPEPEAPADPGPPADEHDAAARYKSDAEAAEQRLEPDTITRIRKRIGVPSGSITSSRIRAPKAREYRDALLAAIAARNDARAEADADIVAMLLQEGACQDCGAAITTLEQAKAHANIDGLACAESDGVGVEPARPREHHASWADDRRRFCGALRDLGHTYEDVADAEEAAGHGRPSQWGQEARDDFLESLGWQPREEPPPPDDDLLPF